MAPTTSLMPDFIRLTEGISIYRPEVASARNDTSSQTSPQTIILCAWFRAHPKHIAKYTAAHRTRSPNAQTLLVESGVKDMLLTSHSTQQEQLKPAVDVLRAAQAEGHRIFLHLFSNGGTNSAVHLAYAWRAATQTPLPINAMALDSCPGATTYRLAATAVISSFPKNQKWWAAIVVWTVIMPLFIAPRIIGHPNLVVWLRESLNDGSLFGRDVPRVYLYSQADRMVPWSAVQEHCAISHNSGYSASLIGEQIDAWDFVAAVTQDTLLQAIAALCAGLFTSNDFPRRLGLEKRVTPADIRCLLTLEFRYWNAVDSVLQSSASGNIVT